MSAAAGSVPTPVLGRASDARLRAGMWRVLWRCMKQLAPYRGITIAAYAVTLVIEALTLITPQFIRWMIDNGIRGADERLLIFSVLGLLAATSLRGVLTYLQGRWSEVASQSIAYDMRKAIHRKLSELSFAYHDRSETGQILAMAIQDVDRIRFVTGRAFLRLMDAALLLVGTAAVLIWMSPRLAVPALLTMPLLVYRAYRFNVVFRPLSLRMQQQLGVLTTLVEQNLRGARVVKAFAQEDSEIARFSEQNERSFDLSARSGVMRAQATPLFDLLSNVAVWLTLAYGGLLVMRGSLSLGALVAFTTYLSQLAQPVRRLGMILPALGLAAAAGERVFEILDEVPDVAEVPDATDLPPVRGHVAFHNVSFAYFGRHSVLQDVSFEAQPGQVVALLGATGSGKTTVINLIPRFYDATAGTVTIDGHDVRQVTLQSLREQIGIVMQETALFATSVRENIALGRPDAPESEIIAAARAAEAHAFISAMPHGYDTRVGERGTTLSGGQRQRIAIARALLKDPRILILDDATSSVDTETEQLIQAALQRLMQGRTSFVIAQRLSTLRLADLILVLEHGRIVDRGTHEDLLRTSGVYAEIYYQQLRPGAEGTPPEEIPAGLGEEVAP